MKILGISCSPRKGQSSFQALSRCLSAAEAVDSAIETELVELAGRDIRPCSACGFCKKNGLKCSIDDDFADLIPILADNDVAGMVVATPVYFGSMTAQCKALIDRCVMFRRNGWLFRDRVGGVLAVGGVRNGGQELTNDAVRAALLCQDMICVSDGKPTAHFGATLHNLPEEGVEADAVGMETAENLGRRVAEVALKLRGNV